MKKEDKRQPVDVTASFLRELEAIDAAKLRVTELKEQELENRKFPIRYNPDLPGWSFEKYEWSEEKFANFMKIQ